MGLGCGLDIVTGEWRMHSNGSGFLYAHALNRWNELIRFLYNQHKHYFYPSQWYTMVLTERKKKTWKLTVCLWPHCICLQAMNGLILKWNTYNYVYLFYLNSMINLLPSTINKSKYVFISRILIDSSVTESNRYFVLLVGFATKYYSIS